MIRSLREVFAKYPALWALLALVIFPFPLREGIKQDAAVYASLARNAWESGVWWPLKLSPHLFPQFYEHPPGIPWAMIPFLSLPGPIEFTASLFSRICTALVFLLGISLVGRLRPSRDSGPRRETIALAFVFLLMTWGQFLKYSATAQLEGPTALVALAVVAILTLPNKRPGFELGLAFLVGSAAMLTKGILFVPMIVGLLAWGLIFRQASTFVRAFLIAMGFATAVGFLSWLDARSGTQFQAYYWQRLLAWGKGDEVGLVSRVLTYLGFEMRYAAAWTLPFFGLLAYRLKKNPRDFAPTKNSSLLLLVYFGLLAPIVFAQMKLAHWTTPLSPLAALWLATQLPDAWLIRFERFVGDGKTLGMIVLAAATLLAIVPYPIHSRFGRGEHFIYHRDELKQKPQPLRVVLDGLAEYSESAFAALYLGYRYDVRYENLESVSRSACEPPSRLWIHPGLAAENGGTLARLGWRATSRQHEKIRLFECRNIELPGNL